ncbi:MAG: hypothetical protein ACFCUV_04705 [Rivularia sp. (in: cyanobacteria)]
MKWLSSVELFLAIVQIGIWRSHFYWLELIMPNGRINSRRLA